MNFLKKFAFTLLGAILVTGCSSTPQAEKIPQTSDNTKVETSDTTQQNSQTASSSENSTENSQTTSSNQNSTENSQANSGNSVAQTTTSQFKNWADVPSPIQKMIEDLNKLGIFDGGEIDLLEPITRGEYIILLFKANNAIRPPEQNIRIVPNYTPSFTDIDPSHPAYKYVQALANTGYSVGYDDKSFQPDRILTREELIGMKIAVDFNDIGDLEVNNWSFSDYEQIDRRFKPSVTRDRVILGDNGTNIERAFGKIKTFKPKQAVARYEAFATLWQIGSYTASKPEGTAKVK